MRHQDYPEIEIADASTVPPRIKNCLGEVFVSRVITGFIGCDRTHNVVWSWECTKCHKTGQGRIYNLRTRRCKRCSSVGSPSTSAKYLACGDISQSFYLHMRGQARQRGIPWDDRVTPDYLWELFLLQRRSCSLTGVELVIDPLWMTGSSGKRCFTASTTASLDRKNSSRTGPGYAPGNLQWVHKSIQLSKRHLSDRDFQTLCLHVVLHTVAKKLAA